MGAQIRTSTTLTWGSQIHMSSMTFAKQANKHEEEKISNPPCSAYLLACMPSMMNLNILFWMNVSAYVICPWELCIHGNQSSLSLSVSLSLFSLSSSLRTFLIHMHHVCGSVAALFWLYNTLQHTAIHCNTLQHTTSTCGFKFITYTSCENV